MLKLQRGLLIALEGIDGSGKSTLARELATFFSSHEIAAVLTKEPGGTTLGKQLRATLHERTTPLNPKAEFLLFAADRAQHMAELVSPALEKKMVVISDRMSDSAIAYQGYGRNLDRGTIAAINAWAMNNKKPDLTIYVRVNLTTSMERIAARNEKLTSFEQEKKEFFQRVIEGYDTMYQQRDDVLIIDGNRDKELVVQQTLEELVPWLKQHHFLL